MTDDDAVPYAGAEDHYAAYRPGYGEAAVAYLAERFALDGEARVLDLGCGAGQLAVPVAAHAGEVVAMDPNETMLDRTRERARTAGRENVTIRAGTDADIDEGMGPVRLTTMGRSFHWMDDDATLRRLRDVTEPGGGVAILDDHGWLTRGTEPWMASVHDAVGRYVDVPEQRAPAEVTYDDPWDELLADCGFDDAEVRQFPLEREWTSDDVVGFLFSLSYCSPDVLGADRTALAADVRDCLAARGGGPFHHETAVRVISGRLAPDGDL
jgi:SAM-dependent methyltransferase